MPNQNNYTRAAQSQFDEVYSEGGNAPFTTFTSTPHLPLLRIPEETYTPGLSYTQDNSPWCSSASDSTYSNQSDGPRNISHWAHRGRSASIPDWPATTLWSPNPANVPPQDLRAPPFESILDPYDTPYMSPRMTPPSRRQQLLDVPSGSFGGIYMESVGTPALSTYIKPVAQHFPASASRVSNSGLESITNTRRSKEMLLVYNIDATAVASYGAQPQLDNYLSSYWQYFHPLFPIVHRPTFDHTDDSLLRTAMAAIGTQYHDSLEARSKGSELNEACRKGIDLVCFYS
jgi:hypothetical protein